MTSRRANGEGSIFPYRNGFAAYVWITTPSGKRTRKYIYGRSREIVHSRWIELTRKAARGPVVTKVPTVGQFLNRWLEDTIAAGRGARGSRRDLAADEGRAVFDLHGLLWHCN